MELKELAKKVEIAVESVLSGSASKYINFEDENENNWTIRISDHKANPLRTDEHTISIVCLVPDTELSEDDNYECFSVSKKEFKNISNQYFLDDNGSFEENFCSIEEMLEYHLY